MPERAYISRSTYLMGATITISLLPPSNDAQAERTAEELQNSKADCLAEQLLDNVFELLNIYNQRFSANDASSELMQVNQAAGKHPIPVDPELFELIQIGKEQSLLPASHLNIAIGPLVQTWRIGFADARIPNNDEVAHALSLTNPQLIVLDPVSCTVFLAKEGMKLDLGCLAKGYIADKIADYLENQHVTSALINLGGNIKTIGDNVLAGRPWQIGIQDPRQPRGTNLA
ncbi:MAG: FAD:protein FMN transferase, partial [Atopobium sp.]|nr:FAD:protein FMN transferase [Atopobium sp.]